MPPDLYHPSHVTEPFGDLAATLEAFGLLSLLDEQLSKPTIGHPMFAARRRRCRVPWLESELAIARGELEAVA